MEIKNNNVNAETAPVQAELSIDTSDPKLAATEPESDATEPAEVMDSEVAHAEPTVAELSTPEPLPEPQAAQPAPDESEIAAMIAEAEERGYLRGRNEAIENALSGPGLWQLATDEGEPVDSLPEVPILQALRPSVWDI